MVTTMKQHWPPTFEGNGGDRVGAAGQRQKVKTTTADDGALARPAPQTMMSPPRRPGVATTPRPPTTPVPPPVAQRTGNNGFFGSPSAFKTPTKPSPRAAPQCSSSASAPPRSPYYGGIGGYGGGSGRPSPTCVIGAMSLDGRSSPGIRSSRLGGYDAASRAASSVVVSSPYRADFGVGTPRRRGGVVAEPTPTRGGYRYHQPAAPGAAPPAPVTPGTPRGLSFASPGALLAGGAPPRCHPVTENRKYKTEMCKNMLETGYCRFGANCHYAHSEEERHAPSAEDLMKDDRLLLPCPIMVSTGHCPYDHRCKSLHDPRTVAYPAMGDDDAIVLEHCTKAKRSGDAIPDRLYHRRLNAMRQENPVVAPRVWEECRPSTRARTAAFGAANDDRSERELELEFRDTYDLVCNVGTDVLPPRTAGASERPISSLRLCADVANKSPRGVPMSELQKLCIVLRMQEAKDDPRLDFVYAPKDCMNGQPCMVLQTRYFHLLDFSQLRTVSVEDIVAEVTPEAYHAGRRRSPNSFACAHEVAFDSMGKRSCNLSVWFDTTITVCSSSKAKKMSKKEEPWRLDDPTGSLFCMPNNDEFEAYEPVTSPYVFMQPVDDLSPGHDLVEGILQHRVATILHSRGFGFRDLPHPPHRLDVLRRDYARLRADLERWAWPKTSGRDHFAKTKEEQNRTVYCPPADAPQEAAAAIWRSFVANLNGAEAPAAAAPGRRRLPVFDAIARKVGVDNDLPRLRRPAAPRSDGGAPRPSPVKSLSEATWRELLLGEGEDLAWKRTIEAHLENQKRGGVRSAPVTPFIHNSFAH